MTAPLPSPNWQPAAARTIPLTRPPGLRLRGLVAEEVCLAWAPKASGDNLDFTLDPQSWLCGTGDYLASVQADVLTATGTSTDLTVVWTTLLHGMACVFLGGGVPGTVQQVRVAVTTQQGRSLVQPIAVAILAEAPAAEPQPVPCLADGTPVPPNAIALPGGAILTGPSGTPYLIA
ncbi:phage fiber-tail adaptor protein [Acetobacter orleanensis]|uniref:Uncharacterized protein n=1 Tax=Acetobacter orleanensis TaxID=104099 RepID=A0A4Y3TGY1_9PROT|nr:hypothetical protein [Acetobacter orleanensis]KXV63937.1 hypothetical protein AD949_06440 [Acetobacter orleanensis]PCD79710.1 hypothetical protein CO710_05760 [Acetobacter orleanensis]GAN69273.1 hypothetical protein Abol_030_038 [Acetobacter orleanensis JCM 7639]GBR28259.1 hypothetical protein AA0473_1688 [Acetobacter orleanensis NRIC 0473]GEB82201.1 hypothetical protein AOR01nite_06780 [Acetobacter orleanensis]